MDYLFDSLRNNTVNALGENSLKNTTNNIRAPSNMSSVVSTSNNSTTNDDESTLYATTENLNKETNDDSRFDISTVNTLFNSSNNLTQIYNSNTTSR